MKCKRTIGTILILLTCRSSFILNAGTVCVIGNKPDSTKHEVDCRCLKIQKKAEREYLELTRIKNKSITTFIKNTSEPKIDRRTMKKQKRKLGFIFKLRSQKQTKSKVRRHHTAKKNGKLNRLNKCPKTFSKC